MTPDFDHRRFLVDDQYAVSMFRRAARQWVRRFFQEPTQVDSVVQAALLEMLERLRAGEEPPSERILYWIFGCTNNAVRRELTRVRRDDAISFESYMHGQAHVDMSETLRLRQELEQIQQDLEACTERARQIFDARMRGLTYREIAATQRVSEETARKTMSDLRKRLLTNLAKRAVRVHQQLSVSS